MPRIKKPKRKYAEAGGFSDPSKLNPIMGSITSGTNLATGLVNTIQNWDDSTKTQKASGVINAAGDAMGTLKAVPGLGMVAGIGEGVLKGVGAITGMFKGKDGKAQEREEQVKQTRLDRYNSGSMFSKHGGKLDSPSTEYKIMPTNKSKSKPKIQSLSKDMDIISGSGQFSHNSGDDIPVDTNNDNSKDLTMEGGEIILKNKDSQYMLNKQISSKYKNKFKSLSQGDNISKKTLDYLKSNAIKKNDENLKSKGLTDRLSYNNGGDTKSTVTLSPNSYNKLAKDKPVMTPQEFQKYLSDTGRTNIKSYVPGTPNKGAQVRRSGGTIKYYDAGQFQNEYEPGDLQEAMNSVTGPMTDRAFRRVQNQIKPTLDSTSFTSKYRATRPVTGATTNNLNTNRATPTSLNKDGKTFSNPNSGVSENLTNDSTREKWTAGEITSATGAMLGTGLKVLALKRNKSLPLSTAKIDNSLRKSHQTAEDMILGAENESIQRVQGSVNKALDQTSYPSVQARLVNMRNTVKGGASAEADVRSKYAMNLSGLKSQNASQRAGLESSNYFNTMDRRQQEIDKRTQGYMDISQDFVNNSFNLGNMSNARKYRQDIMDAPIKWTGSSYELGRKPENGKYGGKIKRSKRVK